MRSKFRVPVAAAALLVAAGCGSAADGVDQIVGPATDDSVAVAPAPTVPDSDPASASAIVLSEGLDLDGLLAAVVGFDGDVTIVRRAAEMGVPTAATWTFLGDGRASMSVTSGRPPAQVTAETVWGTTEWFTRMSFSDDQPREERVAVFEDRWLSFGESSQDEAARSELAANLFHRTVMTTMSGPEFFDGVTLEETPSGYRLSYEDASAVIDVMVDADRTLVAVSGTAGVDWFEQTVSYRAAAIVEPDDAVLISSDEYSAMLAAQSVYTSPSDWSLLAAQTVDVFLDAAAPFAADGFAGFDDDAAAAADPFSRVVRVTVDGVDGVDGVDSASTGVLDVSWSKTSDGLLTVAVYGHDGFCYRGSLDATGSRRVGRDVADPSCAAVSAPSASTSWEEAFATA